MPRSSPTTPLYSTQQCTAFLMGKVVVVIDPCRHDIEVMIFKNFSAEHGSVVTETMLYVKFVVVWMIVLFASTSDNDNKLKIILN